MRSSTLPAFTPDAVAALPGPAWLQTARLAAYERFTATTLPTEAEEVWRYSRIAALDLDRYAPASAGVPGTTGLADAVRAACPGAVVVDVTAAAVAVAGDHPSVAVHDLALLSSVEERIGDVAGEPDAFASLNAAFCPLPVCIDIKRTAGPPPTVLVVHRGGGDGRAVFPRISVRVAEDAEGSVVEVVSGDGDTLVVPVTELAVGPAGRLRYVLVQDLGPDAWKVGLQASTVERDATLESATIALGGGYARLRTDSSLVAPGATGRLVAAYFGTGTQVHDLRTMQGHRAPRTTSDLYFKGVVANRSRSVYTGLIRVEKGAGGTNAFQTNRNLVLHEGAHADSVPNLEIEDNDVRCSHASAVGPVDPDQRFYLESRGVPTDVAGRLIALGFLDEVLERVPVPSLLPALRVAAAAKLTEAERIEADGRGERLGGAR